ncbi:MAG: hypothetical protein ACRDC6_04405, partial [Shewanella sp.]
MDVAFAKGAKAGEPLAKLRAPEGMVTLALPFDLPKPEVGGSSLKYLEVLPGIDLQIDMFADSFTEVLVVKNATALKDPRLAQLQVKFVLDSGLQLKMAEDGSSQVLGPDGRAVFNSPASSMWDSKSSPQAGPKPSARERGQSWHRLNVNRTNTRQGSFAASSSGATVLDVAMPQEALENPVFPVFVDPSMSASVGAYSSVWEHGYTEFNQPGQKLKAGNCGWAACVRQGARARSYISMNAAGLSARDGVLPTIRSAALNGALAWNAASWSTPVDLYTAGAVHADMRWPGPTGERISTASQSWPGPVEFGGEALRAWVQTCVEHGWERTIGLALVSPNESDRNLWKQFDNAFTLTVNYQYQTGTPIVTIGGVCPSDQIAADLRPTLRAVAANRDVSAGSDVRVNFNIRATDGSLNWSSEWLSSATGSFIWPLPGALSPNRTYEVKAQAVTYENGAPIWSGISLWSNVTTFRTDDGAEPTVRALSGDVTNTSRMKAGDISVSSDNQDVVGFAYGFDGDTLVTPVLDGRMCGTFADGFVSGIVPATSSSGSKIGTIPFPWWRSNVHSVKVKAIDAKGRVSEAKVL